MKSSRAMTVVALLTVTLISFQIKSVNAFLPVPSMQPNDSIIDSAIPFMPKCDTDGNNSGTNTYTGLFIEPTSGSSLRSFITVPSSCKREREHKNDKLPLLSFYIMASWYDQECGWFSSIFVPIYHIRIDMMCSSMARVEPSPMPNSGIWSGSGRSTESTWSACD